MGRFLVPVTPSLMLDPSSIKKTITPILPRWSVVPKCWSLGMSCCVIRGNLTVLGSSFWDMGEGKSPSYLRVQVWDREMEIKTFVGYQSFAEHLLSAVTWWLSSVFWCWPLVLGSHVMDVDLCSVWLFSKKQQFVFMDEPEHFPSWGFDCVRLWVEEWHWGSRERNVGWVLTAQAVKVKPKGPIQVLYWQWVERIMARAVRGPPAPLARWCCWGMCDLGTSKGRLA